MDPQRQKVIYIVGSGHCGSTLLDLILGSAPENFSLGELSFFNVYKENKAYNKVQPDNYCTCKNLFQNCSFWKQIKDNQNFFIKKDFSPKESISLLSSIFSPFHGVRDPAKIDDTFALLQEIQKVHFSKSNTSTPTYFVDSSKDPRRLVYLLNDDRIEVYPLFLKKQGTSVARSYNKNLPNLKRKGFLSSYFLRWWLVNQTAQRLIANNPNTFFLSYEKFCRNPQKAIKELNTHFNISISPTHFLEHTNNTTYHSIDGNALRFSPITEIKSPS